MQRGPSVDEANRHPSISVHKIAGDLRCIAEGSKVERWPSEMISVVDIHALDRVDNGKPVVSSDRGKETLRWFNVNLGAPFSHINGVETARNDLTT